jgi:hypothetical protein
MVLSNNRGHGLENSLRWYWTLVSSAYYILLVVYLDDIVITRDYSEDIARLKQIFQQRFHTKDFGKLRYFFGY